MDLPKTTSIILLNTLTLSLDFSRITARLVSPIRGSHTSFDVSYHTESHSFVRFIG